MIEQICAYIHNYFDRDEHGKYWHRESGTFTIADGTITLDFLQNGQYFLIEGSVLNDGIYEYPVVTPQGQQPILRDEIFTGTIYALHIKPGFVALAKEISAWQAKYGDAVMGPYQSESFGGYSYTKSVNGNRNGAMQPAGWQTIFAPRLDEYRKLYRR